jgi:hypothetical protein
MDIVDAFVDASNFSAPIGSMVTCWCARIMEAILVFHSHKDKDMLDVYPIVGDIVNRYTSDVVLNQQAWVAHR